MQNVLQKPGKAHGIIDGNYVKIASKERFYWISQDLFIEVDFGLPTPYTKQGISIDMKEINKLWGNTIRHKIESMNENGKQQN